MDDQTLALLGRARSDDRAALDLLFERFNGPLRRALRRRLGDGYRVRIADSEDAAQDAMLSALRGIGEFDYRGKGSFLAWLLKRAESELLNRVRASRRLKRDGGPAAPLDAAAGVAEDERSLGGKVGDAETHAIVREAIDELPERERDIILLRRFFQLDTAAIQTELDLPSASAVRNLYARAQARLAQILAQRGIGGEAS